MKRTGKNLCLVLGALALFLAGFYSGVCTRIPPHAISQILKAETRDNLRAMAPEIVGHDFMDSMRLIAAGQYTIGFYPAGANATLLVADGRSKRFCFFALDTATNGVPSSFWFIDLRTKRSFDFVDRDADGTIDMYGCGSDGVTMIDRNLDGVFDMKTTPDGTKWLLMNNAWCPYTMTNGAFCIFIEGRPTTVIFKNGTWIRREEDIGSSNHGAEPIR